MAAAEQRNFTTDQTLQMLQDRAKDSDDFYLKLFRKPHPAALPQITASFTGAQLAHFTSPELWIPTLCGGGKYLLQAFHASEPSKQIGGMLNFPIDGQAERNVDFDAPGKAGWRGPQTLEFPKREEARQQENLPLYGVNSPPAPGSGGGASNTNPAWSRSAGGGVHREGYDEPNTWRTGAQALEAERRVLEKEKLEQERANHRAEIDRIQAKHDSELKLSMATLRSEFASAKPTGPDSTMLVFMEMMKQQAASAQAAEARAADDRKEARLAQERADARFFAMIEKIGNKKETDPLEMVAKVIELTGGGKKADSGIIEAQAKMLHSMSEMTQHQVGVAMDFVSAAADMQLGAQKEDKPGWEKALDKVAKGIGNFAAARSAQVPHPPAQQIVGGSVMQQPPPPQTYEQQARQPPPPPQQPRPPQNHTDKSVAVQIKEAIESKTDPKHVAAAVVAYANDPSMLQALAAGAGDPEKAIRSMLGTWVNAAPSNGEYLKVLFTEIEAQAKAAGLIPQDDVAEDSDDEEDEGDEDDTEDQGDDE